MPKNHNIIEISGTVYHETRDAYLFSDGGLDKDGIPLKTWVPKSQCEWCARERIMQMPEWLALEKGFI